MKKPILYCIAAAAVAAAALIAVVGCNNGDGGPNEGLNNFLGGLVNRDPGGNPGGGEDGKFTVTVEYGYSPGGNSYAAGHEVYIYTDKENDGQPFIGWTSESPGVAINAPENPLTSFTMPSNAVTVTANFKPKTKFAVEYDANTGENAPTDHDSPYDSGKTVIVLGPGEMTISGLTFNGWNTKRDGSGSQFGEGESFIITAAVKLYATWRKADVITYRVTVVNGTGGSYYEAGKTVSINATVPSSNVFTGWTVTNNNVTLADATQPTTTFQMPASNVTVTANFEVIPTYTVKVQSAGVGATGNGSYAAGESVAISAGSATGGQQFKNWTGNVDFENAGSSITKFTMPPYHVTVTAIFEGSYAVTVVSEGAGATGGGAYVPGNMVFIEAGTAPAGMVFKNWTTESNGVRFASPTSAKTNFAMPANDVTVKANFMVVYKLTITESPSNGGNVTRNPTMPTAGYEEGTKVTLTATPATGWTFTGWSGALSSTSNSLTITMDGNKTLTATFTQGPTPPVTPTTYTLTVNRNPTNGGTTNPASSQSNITAGTSVNISAKPATDYIFVRWTISSGNGTIENAKSASTTVTANENITVTANFVLSDCGTYCYYGNDGCVPLVKDPSGFYYSNEYWPPVPTPSCDDANDRCIKDGGGLYNNSSCTGNNLGEVLKNDYCDKYCIWDNACSEIRTDRNGAYGMPFPEQTCEDAILGCELGSTPRQTFDSMEECVSIGTQRGWYLPPDKRPPKSALSKSRSASSLRATYSQGAVTASLTLPAAVKFSGGVAELLDDRTGAAVSTAAVSVSGRKAAAVLPVGAGVSAGYYTVRVVLRDRSGGQIVEEASIGIVK